jgi:hypothetical protein
MGRAWTAENVSKAKFKGLEFTGKWEKVFGKPERAHSWTIIGKSRNGKTTFSFQLANYLGNFEKVLYNSREEGLSKSIQMTYKRVGLENSKNVLLINESLEELAVRLSQHKSPNIVIIDSIKYMRLNWQKYERFCAEFPNKLFIWVGRSQGKEPKGAITEDIWYDSFVKIYVEGFRAFISSRFSEGADGEMDIWPEGAKKYWGE